jgi:hypothetical protein
MKYQTEHLKQFPLPLIGNGFVDILIHTKLFSTMVLNDFYELLTSFGIKHCPITTKSPQANAIVEHVHQVIGNMLCTFDKSNATLDICNPWGGYFPLLLSMQFVLPIIPLFKPYQLNLSLVMT